MPEKNSDDKSGGKNDLRGPTTIFIILAAFLGLAYLWYSGLPIIVSAAAAILILVVVGHMVARANGLIGSYGLYLIGTRKGLKLIDSISKTHKGFWEFMVQWGLVLGFGILAYPIFRKQMSRRNFVIGLVSLFLLTEFLSPYLTVGLQFVDISQITSRINLPLGGSSFLGFENPVILGVTLLGGYTLSAFAGIALSTYLTLAALSAVLTTVAAGAPNYAPLHTLVPGVAPLIPGITLPLLAGVLALAVILIVHEFSHGVLARIAGIKLKKIGLVLFGIIPVGAFVEPDEKKIAKLSSENQNRIFAAGVASNFFIMLLFAIPTVLMFVFVVPHIYTDQLLIYAVLNGSPAYNSHIQPGDEVLAWNNKQVSNLSSLEAVATQDKPYQNVSVLTNNGLYVAQANSTGKIGVVTEQIVALANQSASTGILRFLYTFFSLAFTLNFLIAVVNLLPLPSLDGWRIYQTKIRSRKALNAIAIVILLLILVNVLPWL